MNLTRTCEICEQNEPTTCYCSTCKRLSICGKCYDSLTQEDWNHWAKTHNAEYHTSVELVE